MHAQQASSGIAVIGASAGGVEALRHIVRMLPEDLRAAVFIVLHISAQGTSVLPQILERSGRLPARHPVDGEAIACGHIYVAPPDSHLVIDNGLVRVTKGPKENGHRPAIDVLFRSAARSYGRQVMGVILSGNLDDGVKGLSTIKQHGGIAIVQDPTTADYPSMPTSAISVVDVDHILTLDEIALKIAELIGTLRGPDICAAAESAEGAANESTGEEMNGDNLDDGARQELASARASVYSCPDCGGVLMEVDDGKMLSFRCRVGHAWSPESLLAEEGSKIEEALWMALRALEERSQLSRRVASGASRRGNKMIADQFIRRAAHSDQRADVIRELLTLWGRTGEMEEKDN